jgi:protocatechuate 3,4-dioxygenase alpha subunit
MSATLPTTPSQTVGPFFAIGLPWRGGETLYSPATLGERITITGRVLDGDGNPVGDALIEIWQANAAGRYAHPEDTRDDVPLDPAFIGFGRCGTGADGTFTFHTIRPGCVPGPSGSVQAPHLAMHVLARGLLKALITRVYFEESPENEADPILALVPSERRTRLIARRASESDAYRFDIVLQGEGQSIFFSC